MEPDRELRERVRERYAAAAAAAASGRPEGARRVEADSCCTPGAGPTTAERGAATDLFGAGLYGGADREGLPEGAVSASLGCGNPTAVAELHGGQTVLDLGSGAGIDVLLTARRVGPTGKAYGLDMTGEMLDLARRNAENAGIANVEFVQGDIEAVPLPHASVDVVISNCVLNLAADKPAAFAEAYRVLRPGGRLAVTDVVADDHLTADDIAARGTYTGCIAGALARGVYEHELGKAGFAGVSVTFTHEVAGGMHSGIIRARRPG